LPGNIYWIDSNVWNPCSRRADLVGIGCSEKGFGLAVALGDEAVDGSLKVDEGELCVNLGDGLVGN